MTMEQCPFIILLLFAAFTSLCVVEVSSDDIPAPEIIQVTAVGKLGSNATLRCIVKPVTAKVVWSFNAQEIKIDHKSFKVQVTNASTEKDADGNQRHIQISSLTIPLTKTSNYGNYTCRTISGDKFVEKTALLDLRLPTRIIRKTDRSLRIKAGSTVILNCMFEGFGVSEVKWRKNSDMSKFPPENIYSERLNETHINGSLKLVDLIRKDNGTYLCGARDPLTTQVVVGSVDVLVLDKPLVSIDFIKAVGAKKIYFNWTLSDGNSPVQSYTLQYRKNYTETWTYYSTPVGGNNKSFVMSGLDVSTPYQLRISATNAQGSGLTSTPSKWVETLDEDPIFIPEIEVKGFTVSSVTIGWSPPLDHQIDYVHYYELVAQEKNSPSANQKEAIHSGDYRNLPYMFDNLTPDTVYIFKVRSCSELTKECGPWSEPVMGSTMDGIAGPPANGSIFCLRDPISDNNFAYVAWQPPETPNGKIIRYNVEIHGNATFTNDAGERENMIWGPKVRNVLDKARDTRFDSMPANTNITMKISAVTRTKRPGESLNLYCKTPQTTPPRDYLHRFRWNKVMEYDGRWMFKLHLPRVTERNGAICCYRVFMVRMPDKKKLADLPPPEFITVTNYEQAHMGTHGGAYLAEVFTSDTLHSEVILGDGSSSTPQSSIVHCMQCAQKIPKRATPIPVTTSSPITISTDTNDEELLPISDSPDIEQLSINSNRPNVRMLDDLKQSSTTQADKSIDVTEKVTLKPRQKQRKYTTTQPNSDVVNLNDAPYAESLYDSLDNYEQSSFNEERKYVLDDEFYVKRRIIHQNRKRPKYEQNPSDNWIDNVNSVIVDSNDFRQKRNIDGDSFKRIMQDYPRDVSYKTIAKKDPGSIIKRRQRQVDAESFLRIMGSTLQQLPNDKTNNRDNQATTSRRKVRDVNRESFDRIMSEEEEKPQNPDAELTLDDNQQTSSEKLDVPDFEMQTGLGSFIHDGRLDMQANYTGFVELIVHTDTGETMSPIYSDYFTVLNPGPEAVPAAESDVVGIVLKVVCGCLGIAVFLVILTCSLHAHNRHKARQHGVEMHNLPTTLRNIYQGLKGGGGRHILVSGTPPSVPAIAREDLPTAYKERQADSDLNFQREFELLPDCFPDRTMHASEARENHAKNRYPDIKAYDQTRVKLAQIDSIVGSDYINANFVMGYKDRKKFICAQGPTDATVDDFWRMIWEHNLEYVVMLTNLEEYSKVKCAKYWPDDIGGQRTFGMVNVQHVAENRYSDYIVRELKVTKQLMIMSNNCNNQIIENNGIIKSNGSIAGDVSPVSTSPISITPPQERNNVSPPTVATAAASPLVNNLPQERLVKQFHFLMWKDFVAPEYPHSILKFIKRVNSSWSVSDSPLLVHCSAGVGRTGTLVALDVLLDQLRNEGHVAVYHAVADLRRQRNFLVQSLKQYIFVYRVLVENAAYGDTEIPASRLKSSVDLLRNTQPGSDTCAMEEEFEKIKQPPLPEPTKSCAAGGGEENKQKNRSELVIPYDRNRVILTPVPGKDFSTYINASFIEGYDNSESYIITQDPLPNTIADFWRMVSEQGAPTIVMLSEIGEGKCPRYWDDGEVQYDHINVEYTASDSCPYYTKREFVVTNTKNQESLSVTMLQYHGWPTVAGQVPEVTRGLAELADAAAVATKDLGPLVVHCSLGTERSSMFVALSILIAQLRTEKKVDVSVVTRKIRLQRAGCLDTFLQYEFLHRAIVNYAELHNLLDD